MNLRKLRDAFAIVFTFVMFFSVMIALLGPLPIYLLDNYGPWAFIMYYGMIIFLVAVTIVYIGLGD